MIFRHNVVQYRHNEKYLTINTEVTRLKELHSFNRKFVPVETELRSEQSLQVLERHGLQK